jgi:glycerol-3-phosphate dehydrogenase
MGQPTIRSQGGRDEVWERLGQEVFDLAVIGGGINGAGVARDAALRGMSVALIERSDFASGTSSRSSKLIHGGVRYLESGDVGLVLEACRERDLLRSRLAPHLVRAQRFVFPVYADDPLSLWQLRLGLLTYDALAGFRNVERHRILSAKELAAEEPALLSEGARGGAAYYDCATDDARLTLENALAARDSGAAVMNYVEVSALDNDSSGRLAAARLRDRVDARETLLRARSFVNASGPWLDSVRKLDDGGTPPRLKATKGVHALIERERIGNRNAVVIRGVGDDRVMFAIPWQDLTLVGTTDTFYDGAPGSVAVEREDIDYILAAANRAFPGAGLTPKDIVSAYAGLRPLVAPEDESDESDVSRDDCIFESPSGMISIGGGKLTTYRRVAERVVDLSGGRTGRRAGPCRTARLALPLAAGVEPGEVALTAPVEPAGAELAVEVSRAVEQEMAVRLDDVLLRRTQLGLRARSGGLALADETARLMAALLGWDSGRVGEELERYRLALGRSAWQAGPR